MDGTTYSEIGKMEEYGLFEIVVMLALAPVALVVAYFIFCFAFAALVLVGGPLLIIAGIGVLLGDGNALGLLLLLLGCGWTAWLLMKWGDSAVRAY